MSTDRQRLFRSYMQFRAEIWNTAGIVATGRPDRRQARRARRQLGRLARGVRRYQGLRGRA